MLETHARAFNCNPKLSPIWIKIPFKIYELAMIVKNPKLTHTHTYCRLDRVLALSLSFVYMCAEKLRVLKRLQTDPTTATTTIYERVHVDAAALTATVNATVDVALALAVALTLAVAETAAAVAFTRKSLLSYRQRQVMHINDGIKYN